MALLFWHLLVLLRQVPFAMTDLTALGAHIYAGTATIGVERHFRVLAHLEDGYKAGIATAKLNWPEMPIHEKPWPATDYTGTDYIYANPPCLTPGTKVFTIDGPRSIKQLVRERSRVHVLTVDEVGCLTARPIVGWHENPYAGKFYDVRLQSWGKGSRGGPAWARATANHKFLTRRGWVRADKIQSNDEVCTGRRAPNERQRELLDGMMLGDACIKKQGQLVIQQIHHQYIEQKQHALIDFVSKDWIEPEGTPCSGYIRKPRAGFYLGSDGWAKRERQRWYGTGKKSVPVDVRLTPLSIAIWYMDDGYTYANCDSNGVAYLCTDAFTQEDVDRLIIELNRLGINSRRRASRTEDGQSIKYPRICITVEGFKTFIEMIGSYIIPQMRYKLPSWAPVFDPRVWDMGPSTVDWDRVHVVQKAKSTWSHVYCIDVEETHNFVTHGGVAHNCAIFSAAGIRTTRGAGAWQTDPRRGCWYDCFNLIDSIKPRALSIESVTQAYSTGRSMIDELTKLALVRGYSVTHILLNAVHMGVPQRRRRFFFVAHHPNRLVTTPLNWAPATTVGEALAEALAGEEPIAEVLEKHREALRICGPGEGLREAWERLNPPETRVVNSHGEVTGRPSFNEGRLDASKPMGAMVGCFNFHPTEDRRLTPSELKALCGVPDSFRLAGPSPHWASLLARGVMPAVASWLAESVKNTLYYPDGDWRDRTVTLIDLRTPDVEPINLTGQYLDANGRVRFRVRADGTITSSPLIAFKVGRSDGKPEPALARHVPAERLQNSVSSRAVEADEPRIGQPSTALPRTPTHAAADQLARPRQPEIGGRDESSLNPPDRLSAPRGHGGPRRGEMGVHRSQSVAGGEVSRHSSGEGYGTGTLRTVDGDGATIEVLSVTNVRGSSVEEVVLKPLHGEGSGRFIQRLWLTTTLTPDEILALVHANWRGRTTKRSDVYYNYRRLVDAGEAVRPWSVERAPRKEVVPHQSGNRLESSSDTVDNRRDKSEPLVNDARGSRDPVEDRVGPGGAGEGESRTLPDDVGPVATSRSSAGVADDEEECVPRTRDALPKTFKSLADRSGVVPSKGPPIDVALVYLSALPTPEEKPNPVSSVRMAWFLKDELKPDVCYNQNQYPIDFLPSRIGELWVVNSSWTWMKDEWRRVSMRLFDRADRIIFCQNDYTMYLHSYHMGRIREDANYVVLSTCKDVPLHAKHGHRSELVNWNVLTYVPRPETDVERRDGVFYYGSFRGGRQRIFDRYFGDEENGHLLTVSASNGKEVKKFQSAYSSINVVPRSNNVFEELEGWRATLLLEDERATKEYVSPPNRFYEALSSRCPMIFDESSIPMFRRYGYDVEPFCVSRPSDLRGILDRAESVADDQQAWHRDHVGDLRTQFHEAWRRVQRGECGRTGAPPGLKRYSFTEEGGER